MPFGPVLWTKLSEAKSMPEPTKSTTCLHNALKCFAQSVTEQICFLTRKYEHKKNRTQIFIVFGLSIKFFLGVQSTQFYNKTSTSKICLETNESQLEHSARLSPSRCQPRKPPESPFQGTILSTCYWVICHFCLCPEAWK